MAGQGGRGKGASLAMPQGATTKAPPSSELLPFAHYTVGKLYVQTLDGFVLPPCRVPCPPLGAGLTGVAGSYDLLATLGTLHHPAPQLVPGGAQGAAPPAPGLAFAPLHRPLQPEPIT